MPRNRIQSAQDETSRSAPPQVGGHPPTVGGVSSCVTSSQTVLENSSSCVGRLSELTVERALISRGCQVFRPSLDHGEIDMIALTPTGRFWRIQIKTAWHRIGIVSRGKGIKKFREELSVELRRHIPKRAQSKKRNLMRPYTQVDVFLVAHQDTIFVIPFSQVGVTKMRLRRTEFRDAWHLMGLA